MNLIERVARTQETIDRYLHEPFEWGKNDCGQMSGWHLENMGRSTPLSQFRKYKTETGAKRALALLGFSDMEAVVDAQGYERIAPASVLPGDLLGIPGGTEDAPWTALAIAIGNDRLIGFADVLGDGNGQCEVGPISVATMAWRVV